MSGSDGVRMLVQRDAGEVTLGRKLEVKSVAKIYPLGSGSDLFVEQLILPVLYDMCVISKTSLRYSAFI
jgi:hypothetical protein